MDKCLAKYLKDVESNAKSIYQNNRNRDNLYNYLIVRNLVKICCDASKAIDQASASMEKANQCFKDYRYLFDYFKHYIGKNKYSEIMYNAYVGLLSQEGAEKRDDLQGIARKINRVQR